LKANHNTVRDGLQNGKTLEEAKKQFLESKKTEVLDSLTAGEYSQAKTELDLKKQQEIQDSIAEGELILRTGSFHGRKFSKTELEAVKRQVEKDRAKLQATDKQLEPTNEPTHTALVELLKNTGVDNDVVVANTEELNKVLSGGETFKVVQNKLKQLEKAAKFIRDGLANNVRGKSFTLELPISVQRMIKNAMGRDFDSHSIEIGGIRHSLKEHGVNGNKITDISIPVTAENAELIPLIMTAPDRVTKGSTDQIGRESIRFYKTLENGHVVVVEKEQKNSPDDMETITMWAEKSSNVVDAKLKTSPKLHAQDVTISRDDIAKIHQDAENAIKKDENLKFHAKNSSADELKAKQFGIVSKYNPAPNNYNTWIRSAKEIKTAAEAFEEAFREGNMYPDFTVEDMKTALDKGKVTIYSSYPIEHGKFVTPSRMNAKDYSVVYQVKDTIF